MSDPIRPQRPLIPREDPSTKDTLPQHHAYGSEMMQADTAEVQRKYPGASAIAIAQLVEGRATRRIADASLHEISETKNVVAEHGKRLDQLETRPIVVSIAPPPPPASAFYSVPPPATVPLPERDPMTSTGQHAIVVAGAALQAAENAHAAVAAASVDYAREQERAKAELLGSMNVMAKTITTAAAKWIGIGGVVFAILTTVAGYLATRNLASESGAAAAKGASQAVHQEAATVANETKQAVKEAVDESVQTAPKGKP